MTWSYKQAIRLCCTGNGGILDPLSRIVILWSVTDLPRDDTRPHKLPYAISAFLLALILILFTDLRLSVALMSGALLMILSGVLRMDEAYRSIGWQSVFLLASLIPLGVAVEATNTAAWIAQQILALLLGDVPIWWLQAAIAVLATSLHPGYVECWSDSSTGAPRCEYRGGCWRRPSRVCADSRTRYIEFFFDSNPPGECADHGSGWIPGKGFRAGGWHDDDPVPGGYDRYVKPCVLIGSQRTPHFRKKREYLSLVVPGIE